MESIYLNYSNCCCQSPLYGRIVDISYTALLVTPHSGFPLLTRALTFGKFQVKAYQGEGPRGEPFDI